MNILRRGKPFDQRSLRMEMDKCFLAAAEAAGNCLAMLGVLTHQHTSAASNTYFKRNRAIVKSSLQTLQKQGESYLANARLPEAHLVRAVLAAEAALSACAGCKLIEGAEVPCGVLQNLKGLREPLQEEKQYIDFLGGAPSSIPEPDLLEEGNPFVTA